MSTWMLIVTLSLRSLYLISALSRHPIRLPAP